MVKIKAENRAITSYYRYQSLTDIGAGSPRLRGPWRVVVFCLVTILVPILFLVAPLFIRYEYYKDVIYNLGESDLVTVDKPISTFWCEGQDLWMNATFHAYLMNQKPEFSEDLSHFEMDKHMQLADDSLEYWGFFLLQGSKVTLSVCSRYEGSRIMVVKGTKNLKHCALLDPDPNIDQVDPWEEDVSAQMGEKIEVTFEQGEHKMVRGGGSGKGKMVPATQTTKATTATTTTTLKPEPEAEMPEKKLPVSIPTMLNGKGAGKEELNKLPEKKAQIGEDTPEMQKTDVPSPSKKPSRTFRIRGRKPVSVQVEGPEGAKNSNSSKNVRPIHENIRVQRHKIHPGVAHSRGVNRVKRLLTTSDQQMFYNENEGDHTEDSTHTEQITSEEEDLPPNPVGVEPEKIKMQNQAQADLSVDKGGIDEEVIDEEDIRSSGSSFAKNIWTCYGGDTVFTQSFSPSQRCQSQDSMMKHALKMKTVHEITSTGYYYYIFYSDNDIVSNDIFARFNIEKVVYHFPNYTNSCLNKTQCSLDLNFLSSEKVLLEVPLQDGVSDEDAQAQMVLISSCRPRLGVYLIFPIAILVFIICCAFI